ncbi:MAG: diaminopimelate epimerase [Elusimicrobia bacterium]|nr:diaminopimelate epimerase [Elusimicrobiota bacterium]
MKLRFWKLSGAGNDFVLLAGRRGSAALARRLCSRRAGIGADGLLGLTRRGGRLRLDYRNADGSSAFCGNGTRCAALWAAAHGWVRGPRFVLHTARGPLGARLSGRGRASISMPVPRRMRLARRLKVFGRTVTVHFVEVGVPHAVVFVPDVERADLGGLGRALRFHKAFGRAGANVDFVQVRGRALLLRTYERGVEGETLACGTGAVAVAAVARALGRVGDRARVRARGGVLDVELGAGARLEGPGETVFTGEVDL